MVRNKNQTVDIKVEHKFTKGKKKLSYKTYKNSSGKVPIEVVQFLQEFLDNHELKPCRNVLFKGLEQQFYLYFPDEKIVLDFIESKETDQELEEIEQKKTFCKKMGITRIAFSKYSYKNAIPKLINLL